MKQTEYYVSWEAATYIWFGQLARLLVACACLYGAWWAIQWLLPVFYADMLDFDRHYEKPSWVLRLLLLYLVQLWALRESLTDRYSTFSILAETKKNNQSLFTYSHRLPWFVIISVWWAQTWRTLLVPAALVGGCLAAMVSQHPNASYSQLLNHTLVEISMYSTLVFSFWATRESLGDRYWSYRFVSKPKNLYKEKQGPLD